MASKTIAQLTSALGGSTTNISNIISTSNLIEPPEDQAVRLEQNTIIQDIIDSIYTKADGITIANVTGLVSALAAKENADITILKQANIVDNLITTSATAPLSANQGKVLKDLIDALPSVGSATALDTGNANEVTSLELRNHLDDTSIHFQIIDGSIASTSTWSSNKITGELATKAATSHTHAQLHNQNSDTLLASGTGNEVSAADLRAHLDSTANPHTTTITQTITAAGTALTKGTLYVSNGSNIVALATGLDGQVLKANSATISGLNWSDDVGEVNTISSLGSGTSLVSGKSGVDLQIRSVSSTSNLITVGNNGNVTEFTFNPVNLSHTAITDVGTNTHAQIDAHIAATNPHGLTFDDLSPATSQGDLIIYNGSASVRFGRGTTGQVLTSTGTSLAWSSDLATTVSHVSTINNPHQTTFDQIVDAQFAGPSAAGTVYYSDGTNVQELGIGTTGQVLKVNALGTAPEWGTDSGEANTFSSLAGTGQEVISTKVGVDLQFKRLESGNAASLDVSTSGNQIVFEVLPSGISHDALSGLGGIPTNTHAQIDAFIITATTHIGTTTGNPHNVTAADIGVEPSSTANPQQTALTASVNSLTQAGSPSVQDFNLQALTNTSAWGFASQDEGETFLQVILNMQTRINELEAKLQLANILA